MEFKFVISFLLLLAIGSNAKKLPLEESRPYVMSLSLELKEEKVVDFIIDSLFATSGWKNSTPYCPIQLSDVLSIIPFKKTSAIDLNNAITQYLHLEITDDEINNFVQNLDYTTLSFMGLNVGSVYKNFVKTYLATDPTRIMDVLNVLGIAQDFAVAYAFGKDADMFAALQKANFSLAALTEIETLLNVTFNMKDLTKVLGIKKLNPLYLQKFINEDLTNYLGLTEPQETDFVNFLNSFMLEADDYKDIKGFKMCYKELTQNVALGVAISQNEIITNDFKIYESYNDLKDYVNFKIISVQMKTPYLFSSFETLDVFNKITITGVLPQYIETTTSYADIDTKMCTYVTIGTKKLMEQPVTARMVGNELKIAKTFMTTFKTGSPLICDGILYGLAAAENMLSIIFDVFEEKGIEQIENEELMYALNNLFEEFGINPCDYFSCTPPESINGGFVVVPPVEGNFEIGSEEYDYYGEENYEEENNEEEINKEENNEEVNKIVDVEEGNVDNENVQGLEEANVEEQQVAQEQPTEEQVVEEQAEVGQQPVVQQVVEENPVKEQAVQEQPIEEQVAEENLVKEQPIEEQVVQEQAEVGEQPVEQQVIEENPVKQEGDVEQLPVEQQIVEENPVKEQAVPEQAIEEQIVQEQAEVGQQPVEQQVAEESLDKEQAVQEQPIEEQVVEEQADVGQQVVEENQIGEQVDVGQLPVEQQVVEENLVEEQAVQEQPIEEQVDVGQQPVEDFVIGEGQHTISEELEVVNKIDEQVIDDQQVIEEQVIPHGEGVDDEPCISDQLINEVNEEVQLVEN
ncbi:uncharacterized protein [Onthophagus taurus]|uniref:uncharacterized protein n=1 Tax=Onthophagus taurus TaxID=166361 RepID=UPI0039BE5AE6